MIFRDIKNKIKFKYQKAKKGYCDYDLYDIDGWFMEIFPKMLKEFAESTCSCPMDDGEMLKDVEKMPKTWVENQRSTLINISQKNQRDFDEKNTMNYWLLILLRMEHCFELCDDSNSVYDAYKDNGLYKDVNDRVEEYKKEGFYYFEKYFFNLWW